MATMFFWQIKLVFTNFEEGHLVTIAAKLFQFYSLVSVEMTFKVSCIDTLGKLASPPGCQVLEK